MQIAVCDDDKREAEQLAVLIGRCPQYKEIPADIYDSFSRLLRNIKSGKKYDVVFMDIEWKMEDTGIDFASMLYAAEPNAQIVFATGYAKYSQDIFSKKINLAGFLIKPVDQEKLNELAEVIEKKRELRSSRILNIISDRKSLKIPADRILYIESNLHQCLIHTDKESIKCSEKLTEILKRLPENFQMSHKSYLINMDRIYKMEGNTVYLDNGECLPISRAQNSKFTEKFFRYIGEKDG